MCSTHDFVIGGVITDTPDNIRADRAAARVVDSEADQAPAPTDEDIEDIVGGCCRVARAHLDAAAPLARSAA